MQTVRGVHREAGAGGANGVPEGKRTTLRVDAFHIDTQLAGRVDDHIGESFIDFH